MSRFATTNWSLILRAASADDAEARLALALLCEAYWYPVYAYVRHLGANASDAEDLTQGYFARFLEKRVVREVRPELGRFRSFLFVSVRNFMNNERDRERAVKRGGGRRLVSLDVALAEAQLKGLPRDLETPERAYERTWAETVMSRVHQRLEQEVRRRGAAGRFEELRSFVADRESEPDYPRIARAWGVGEPAVRTALHRLRKRFDVILRDEVARTVQSRREIEDEVRHLLGALRP